MISEKLINSAVEQMQTGMVIINHHCEVIYSNSFLFQKTGYSNQELLGTGFFDNLFSDSETRKNVSDHIKACFHKPFVNYEVAIEKKDKKTLTIKINGAGFDVENNKFVSLVILDVTNQRAFEQVIQASYDHLQQTTIDLNEALEKIKEQQALLAEYKRKMDRELTIATSVQNAIIPTKFRSDSRVNIWGVAVPSDELGGDYFDFFQLDENSIGILIADVVGHGVPAALIATMLKAYFEYYTKHYKAPEMVFYHINTAMCEILKDTGLYITAFYSVLDLNKMEITSTSAGHDSALCFFMDSDQPVRLKSSDNGTILGAFPDSEYDSNVTKLKPGSRIVFFTDGIVEAKSDKGEFFGLDRFIEFINNNQEKVPEKLVHDLMESLNGFYGQNKPNDDRTIIVIDVLPDWHSIKNEKLNLEHVNHLIQKQDYRSALEKLTIILKSNEKLTEAYILMGKTYIHLEKYEEAEDNLQKAVLQDDRAYKAYYYLGIVSFNLKQYLKARNCWLRVKEIHPNYLNTEKYLDMVDIKLNPQDLTGN